MIIKEPNVYPYMAVISQTENGVLLKLTKETNHQFYILFDQPVSLSKNSQAYLSFNKDACIQFLENAYQKLYLDAKFKYEQVQQVTRDYEGVDAAILEDTNEMER